MTKIEKQESGRSMVEMLGVLAIIGVLSVGGIAGFKVAMKKHQANDLLNELNIRANSAAMQLTSDANKTPNLLEFGKGFAGCDDCQFSYQNVPSSEQFMLKVTGVSKEICETISNMVGSNNIIREISTCPTSGVGEITFLFNKDLSITDEVIASCPEGSILNEDKRTCDKGGQKVCTNNSNCPKTQYCKVGIKEHQHFDDCSVDSGVCTDLGTSESYDSFIWSTSEKMNFYSAQNWCKAKKSVLAKQSTLMSKIESGLYTDISDYIDKNAHKDLGANKYWLAQSGTLSCISDIITVPFLSSDDIDKEHYAFCDR